MHSLEIEEDITSASSISPQTWFNLLKFRFMSFIHNRYITIIFILFSILCSLIISVIVLFCYVMTASVSPNNEEYANLQLEQMHRFARSTASSIDLTIDQNATLAKVDEVIRTTTVSISPYKNICNQFNCTNEEVCNIQIINYETIQAYSCCNCIIVLSRQLIMLRYDEFVMNEFQAIVLDDFINACSELAQLQLLPQLHCLMGSWDVLTSAHQCYLYYSIVGSSCLKEELFDGGNSIESLSSNGSAQIHVDQDHSDLDWLRP